MSMLNGYKERINRTILQYAALYIILFAIMSVSRIDMSSDDGIFIDQTKNISLLTWLSTRYLTWSGRLFSEACVYLIFGVTHYIWYIITPAAILVTAYSIVRIIKKEVVFRDVIISVSLFFMMYSQILTSSVFWMTGAVNYLWPAAIALIGIIPYADAVLHNDFLISKPKAFAYGVCLICGVLGTEQISACILAFSLLTHIYFFVHKKRISKVYYVLTMLILISFAVSYLSPGNAARMELQIPYYEPDFYELSFFYKLFRAMVLAFKKIFDYGKLLILLLGAITIIYSYRRKMKKSKLAKVAEGTVLALFLVAASSMVVYNANIDMIDSVMYNLLYDFDLLFNILTGSDAVTIGNIFKGLLPYAFWCVFVIGIYFANFQSNAHNTFTFFCFCAMFAAILTMAASPTIYASGNRISFCSFIILIVMIFHITTQYKVRTNKIAVAFAIPALCNLICTLYYFKDGFFIMY